jgi:osmoprotectant transport system ATP-binding protein
VVIRVTSKPAKAGPQHSANTEARTSDWLERIFQFLIGCFKKVRFRTLKDENAESSIRLTNPQNAADDGRHEAEPFAALIELQDIRKEFAGVPALLDISLEIQAGRRLVLVGESGSGKSTLLRLLIGLERPDAGQLHLLGQPVEENDWQALRARIGYVIQDGGLFPHLSAAENVTLAALAMGWKEPQRQKRLSTLADMTQVPIKALDRYPHQLSGGQRQRVALMRGLMLDPDILLLDEPLGALDPIIRFELQQELLELFEALEKTVVIVTHDLPEAAFFSQDLVVLHQGRVQQRGSIADLSSTPANEYVAKLVAAVRSLPGDRS